MSTERQLSDVSDAVYPLYPFDNEKTNRCFVSWPMLFNDVLDPELLNNALCQLLGMKEWCKLGGRLRLKVGCVLFSHFPTMQITHQLRHRQMGN